ncbi:hypothetical protein, partial [Streptococcus gordonii]|uniref:hypothetical protein n=1 Tax=Streptococcus gordonii TaxID=1302 RepID=UPI001D07E97C
YAELYRDFTHTSQQCKMVGYTLSLGRQFCVFKPDEELIHDLTYFIANFIPIIFEVLNHSSQGGTTILFT